MKKITSESIESLNQQLIDLYGIDTINGLAIWRIVWSEDQFEKRLGTYDDFSGHIFLRTVREVREVPKYRQWIRECYVLEQLTIVPEIQADQLPTNKISYEPMFPFQRNSGESLPPRIDVCKIVIDSVYAAKGKSSLSKYTDPRDDSNNGLEARANDLRKTQEELFGGESDIADALHFGEGVAVPHNYKVE